MAILSKSKIIAHLQCPKRLWLQIHKPDEIDDSAQTKARFEAGNAVGEIARAIYDPKGIGRMIDIRESGIQGGIEQTKALLNERLPIFEAGFSAEGARAFADVLVPEEVNSPAGWHMVEVKSSTSVKEYHVQDIAIQALVASSSGLNLTCVALAHIDSSWTYPGQEKYQGLLREVDLTEQARSLGGEVHTWISDANETASQSVEPEVKMGGQCSDPVQCGFEKYCRRTLVQAEFPVEWLPGALSKGAKQYCSDPVQTDMREIPDEHLSQTQRLVRDSTVSGKVYFDAAGARTALLPYPLPAYFLDFETIQFAVPIWAGTRPYDQIPFQYSLHYLDELGQLQHKEFLDTSGGNPSRRFAEQLLIDCALDRPVYVYNAGFESARIKELARRFNDLADSLLAINSRMVDLLPIARKHFYHPNQHGSWSIKHVLPAIDTRLGYENLEGVRDGGMAQVEFLKAIDPTASKDELARIRTELLAYCGHDTYALVKLWQFFAGRNDLRL